jgi:alpha-tubulin suppressor-like RCC1 family protein
MAKRTWILGVGLTALAVVGGVLRVGGGTQAGGAGFVVLNTPAGAVWTWGANGDGQLGDNSTTQRKYPGPVSGMGTVTAVAAGASHALAIDSTGVVWAWGDNFYGQLGDSTTTDRKLPVQLALTGVVAIAAGGHHSLALNSSATRLTRAARRS